ncbi:MAG: hypothetical protein V3T31_10650, partial [candidate division Zixibacteria bacterium]
MNDGIENREEYGMVSKFKRALLLICLAILATFTAAEAQQPTTISYQGRLVLISGEPVITAVEVTFSLYPLSAGGVPLWAETHTVVADEIGIFTVELGSVVPLDESILSGGRRWLGMQVGLDTEMSPRQLLASVPYSLTTQTLTDGIVSNNKLATNAVTSDKVLNSSLSSADLSDEPGVAGATWGTERILSEVSLTNVLSETIYCPANGVLLAIVTANLFVSHNNGTSSQAMLGLSADAASIPATNDLIMLLPPNMPSGNYWYPISLHVLIDVAAGDTTLYFMGQKLSAGFGIISVRDVSL